VLLTRLSARLGNDQREKVPVRVRKAEERVLQGLGLVRILKKKIIGNHPGGFGTMGAMLSI